MHPLIYVPRRSLVVPDRAPRRLGCGVGCGVGGSPPPWTPAAVPGCILYGGAYLEARAVRALQPVLLNGSFESGTANWTGYNSPTFTAESSGAADGSKWGKVAYNGTASPQVAQSILIAGNRYAVGGWARGDGTYLARVMPGGTTCFDSTTSTDWQAITGNVTATNALLYCICNAGAAGFAGFDGLTVANLSLQSYTPQFTTIPGSVLAQATATAQPWVSSDGLGVRYENDVFAWNAAKASTNCMHDGTGGTAIFAARPVVVSADNRPCGTMAAVATNTGFEVAFSATHAYLWIGNGSGVLSASVVGAYAFAPNTTYLFMARVAAGANAVSLWVNDTQIGTATINAPSASDSTNNLQNGRVFNGIVGHNFVANRAISDAEYAQIRAHILAQATL